MLFEILEISRKRVFFPWLPSENKYSVFYVILQLFAILFLNASENEVLGTVQTSA